MLKNTHFIMKNEVILSDLTLLIAIQFNQVFNQIESCDKPTMFVKSATSCTIFLYCFVTFAQTLTKWKIRKLLNCFFMYFQH